MTGERPVETLRLGTQELTDLVAELEREAGPGVGSRGSKRESRRWRAQHQKIVVTLQDENGPRRSFVMVPRNISTGGMGLLHGAYVHVGCPCAVALRDTRGRGVQVKGTIIRCKHLRGSIHDIGVRFDERVNPRDFFIWAGNEYLFNAERVDPKVLKGRVLVIDDSLSDQRLISHLLKETSLEFEYASTAEDGLAMLETAPSIALVDYVLPDMDGISVVTAARTRGCVVPMVLISGCAEQETRYAAIAAGAKEMLFKPLTEQLLMRAMAEFLLYRDIQARDEDPFRSTAKGVSEGALEACIDEVRMQGERLAKMLETSSLEKASDALTRLSGLAADYGLRALKTRTTLALEKQRRGDEGDGFIQDCSRVVEACRMARG